METPCAAWDSVAAPTSFPCPFCSLTVTGLGALLLAAATAKIARSAAITTIVFLICFPPRRQAYECKPARFCRRPLYLKDDILMHRRSRITRKYTEEAEQQFQPKLDRRQTLT